MTRSTSSTTSSSTMRSSTVRPGSFWRRLLGLLLLAMVAWFGWLYFQIKMVAGHDEARPADAIAVFGAAEYGGRPSPVLHARLDHALDLYNKRIAPLLITLGGSRDRNSGLSEGGVGRDYLLANGVPYDHIIAETESVDTDQQVTLLAEIAQSRGLKSIVVVSDGTHLFRIKKLCAKAGLNVYLSPRASKGHLDDFDQAQRYFHEMLAYTAEQLHLKFD